jgi:glycosyltransferase involved in cell wall biosynthesis
MACGTPVIVSNAASLPEVVGGAGLLVNPYKVDEIAAAIEKLLSDKHLQSELRHKGIERAKKYTWDETARRVWQVLQEVAQGVA